MGCLGVPTPQYLTKGCPVMIGHPTFHQIIINFHRIFAYLCTMSIQKFSCDTNKWFVVDFLVNKGTIFCSKCTVKRLAVGLRQNRLGTSWNLVGRQSLACASLRLISYTSKRGVPQNNAMKRRAVSLALAELFVSHNRFQNIFASSIQ